MSDALTMDEASHTYRVGGRRIPGVTEVLRAAGLTPSMEWVSEYALDRGRQVHKAVALYAEGMLDESDLDPVIVPRLAAYKAWRATLEPDVQVVAIEQMRASATLNFCGTPDQILRIAGTEVVVELKCGAPHASHAWQGAAYQHLTGAAGRLGLYLAADGRYKAVPWTNRQDWPIFQSALALYAVRAQHNLLPA